MGIPKPEWIVTPYRKEPAATPVYAEHERGMEYSSHILVISVRTVVFPTPEYKIGLRKAAVY